MNPTGTWLDVFIIPTIVVTGLVICLWRPARAAHRAWRAIMRFLDDWHGEEPRPGVPARPGVLARLDSIEEHQNNTDKRLGTVEATLQLNGRGRRISHLRPPHSPGGGQ